MSQAPHISVIIPTWNSGETLQETVECLQNQTWPHWTACVVDGGSTDGSFESLQALADRDPRFVIAKQQGTGLSGARNEAMDLARGDLLHCLDADDLIDRNFYERMAEQWQTLDSAQRKHCCLVSDACKFTAPRRVILEAAVPDPDYFTWEGMTRECRVPCNAMVFSRAILDRTGTFDESIYTGEDWDLWVRFLRVRVAFIAVSGVRSWYRIHEGTLSRNFARYLPAAHEVIQRFASADARCVDAVDCPGLNAAQLDQVMVRFWRENIRRAATALDREGLKILYGWAANTLPAAFWRSPGDFIEHMEFRPVDLIAEEGLQDGVELEARLVYLHAMITRWNASTPCPFAEGELSTMLYYMGLEGRRFNRGRRWRLARAAHVVAWCAAIDVKYRKSWLVAFWMPRRYAALRKTS